MGSNDESFFCTPCTPERLRTSSYPKCTLPLLNQEHQGPTQPYGFSQTHRFQISILFPVVTLIGWVLLPRGFVPVIVFVAIFSWEGFFFPGLLRVAAPGPSHGAGEDTKSDDGESLPHVPSEVLITGPWMLGSLGVGPRTKVCHRTWAQLPESFEYP